MRPEDRAASHAAIFQRPPDPRKFVLVKGMAGLGNRILSAMGGVLYALIRGRTLVIDWTDPLYSSEGENVFHRFFTSPACSPADEIPQTDSVAPALWRGRLAENARVIVRENHYDPDQVRRELSIDFSRLDYQEEVLVVVQYDARIELFRPHFQGPFQELAQMRNRAILRMLLRDNLILKPEIRERVDDFKRGRFASPTVGVHVRFSDYRVRILAIIKHLNALIKRDPGLQIFLATDNIEIKKLFETNYPRVITTSHWYGRPGRPIHNSSAQPRRTESAIEALMDIYLLAECDHIIGDSSSSFADLAMLLSPAPEANKIDVSIRRTKGNRRLREAMTRILGEVKFSSWAFRLLPKLVPIRRL